MIKLEKIIGKFSKDIGFDKKDLLKLLLGEKNQNDSNNINILDNQ